MPPVDLVEEATCYDLQRSLAYVRKQVTLARRRERGSNSNYPHYELIVYSI